MGPVFVTEFPYPKKEERSVTTSSSSGEIDSNVFLRDAENLQQGDIVNVKIEEADDYDLFGVAI